ncbi:hypothetical protein [Chromobacterium violaceum]|uniref:hypothetical protein n=1 Tax=Chromobacterium violaceum TaxID=536 RepID=UPI001CE1CF77|nr:hypothetical protein [Chromobacterium violaceum]
MQTLNQLADAVENALAEDADQETLDAIADLIAAVRATERSGEAVAESMARETEQRGRAARLGMLVERFQPAPEAQPAPTVIEEIAAERRRQIEVEGWTPEHDDAHSDGQMAGAAACYAMTHISHWERDVAIKRFWPWDASWWKPTTARRNLVKAGALIVAELERIDRRAAAPQPKEGSKA